MTKSLIKYLIWIVNFHFFSNLFDSIVWIYFNEIHLQNQNLSIWVTEPLLLQCYRENWVTSGMNMRTRCGDFEYCLWVYFCILFWRQNCRWDLISLTDRKWNSLSNRTQIIIKYQHVEMQSIPSRTTHYLLVGARLVDLIN